MFSTYFQLGFFHVTDLNGYDHIIFLLALMATFLPKEYGKIIWLVTAFTVGHCCTLLLSAYDIFTVDPAISEKLIPITILLTAISNFFPTQRSLKALATITFLFGLIHGLAFSNYFKVILMEDSIILPLFGFNLGVELGQLVIIAIGLCLNYFIFQIKSIPFYIWNYTLSGLAILLSLQLLLS